MNSGGVPPTILAAFVGTVIVLHDTLVSGDGHPVYVNPPLEAVVSVNVNLVIVPQSAGELNKILVSSSIALEVSDPELTVFGNDKSKLYEEALVI